MRMVTDIDNIYTAQVLKLVNSWQLDPLKFVLEGLKLTERGYTVTDQQKQGLTALGMIVFSKIKAYDLMQTKFSDKSKRINADIIDNLEGLTDREKEYAKKIGISIMAGRGPGKDAFLAWAILWFLCCFKYCKIPCTAPTESQLKTILWAEIQKWGFRQEVNQNGDKITPISKDWLTWQSEKIFLTAEKGREWIAYAKTANVNQSGTDQAESMSGAHADYMFFAVDESSKLAYAHFIPMEHSLTSKCNFIINIFNPTRNNGYAFDTHHRDKERWVCLHWNAEDSPIVSKTQIEKEKKKYGVESNEYRVNVKGLPPIDSSETIIPREWVLRAVELDIIEDQDAPLIFGVDVAYQGKDLSAIVKRKGCIIKDIKTFSKIDTQALAKWIAHEIVMDSPAAVYIDSIGYGAGVCDRLNEMGFYIHKVNTCEQASNEELYDNLRAELHFKARKRFEEQTIKILDYQTFTDELSNARLSAEPSRRGRILVMSKKIMKAKGIPSPNILDAFLLTLKDPDSLYIKREIPPKWRYGDFAPAQTENAWMAA